VFRSSLKWDTRGKKESVVLKSPLLLATRKNKGGKKSSYLSIFKGTFKMGGKRKNFDQNCC